LRAVIALDLDYFYAQCEEVRNPPIKQKPVVVCVYSGRTETSGAVSTCNYIARKLGVKSGIPISRAIRILESHEDALFLPVDMEYYETISERIMELIRRRTDKFEQASIDEAFAELMNFDPEFRSVSSEAKDLKGEILSSEKMTCSVGVGQNKLLAKMAVDSNKPDGFTVILPGKEHPFLDQLPVGKLFGIGPKTEAKLVTINVLTIGQLAETDEGRLSDLFGINLGPEMKQWANGIDNAPVSERPIEQISRIVTLKKDAETFDFQDSLKEMAKDLSNKLKSLKFVCKSIGIIAINSQLKIKSRAKSSSVGTQSYKDIYDSASELCSALFEEARLSQSPLKLRRVGIRLAGLEPRSTNLEKESLEQYFQ
jgi:DNA polymerase IV (archaeal DinB-like DNA polymerase)